MAYGLPLPELEDIARRMTAALVHRGPDDEGIWANEMAVGLEARVPVLDHRVVALAARLPSDL